MRRPNRMATQCTIGFGARSNSNKLLALIRENLAVLRDDFEFQKPVPSHMQASGRFSHGLEPWYLLARMQTSVMLKMANACRKGYTLPQELKLLGRMAIPSKVLNWIILARLVSLTRLGM